MQIADAFLYLYVHHIYTCSWQAGSTQPLPEVPSGQLWDISESLRKIADGFKV